MKKFGIFLSVALAILLTLTLNSAVFADDQDAGIDKVGQHMIEVDGKKIPVNVTLDQGRYVLTTDYPLSGPDSKAIIEALTAETASLTVTVGDEVIDGWFTGWDQWSAYAWGSNGYANISGHFVDTFNHPNLYSVDLNAYGDLFGYWAGGGTPEFVQLIQTLSVSGNSITFSWPPSFSPSGYSATYTSAPFYNTTYAGSSYTGMYAISYFAIYSYTQSDGVIIRISNYDYRANSTIYTNWMTGQCTTSPSGYYYHYSG